jgi:uncharacterized protein
MEKKLDPQHLDVLAFARDACHLQGEGVLADWPRLAEEQHGETLVPGSVNWLDLSASVQLPMQCQRCLTPVLETVEAERSFRFVADEATAAALDDEAEEDILVISRDFDALALVEDELILSLPLVPLHEVCPLSVPMSSVDPEFEEAAERPNPFGVLAGLKTNKSS